MKIGIIDADLMDNGTRHPNLALMKISGYYKEQGHDVKLIYKSYDEVYDYDKIFLAKVFTFTYVPEWVLEIENLEKGGTGFYQDGGKDLDYEIEHHKPDYTLYDEYVQKQLKKGRKRTSLEDYIDYSIGFSTRGCFRKCKFCVNKKYRNAFKHSPIEEFLDESRPYLYLWDDNFLAYDGWESILDDIEKTGKPFQFRQGLDLRLMDENKARRLNNTNYHGDFIFAFDNLKDKDKIIDKIQLWKRYSNKICKLYVLCGFESQDEKDIERTFERISILMKYGSLPYIMRHEKYKESKYKNMYIELARWCNQPQFYKKKSFREFCIANQKCKKDQSKNCSSYQAMLDFEKEFPEIAEKYFDLKFEEENIYKVQYGYGRKYQNKPLCKDCQKNKQCWDLIIMQKGNCEIEEKFIQLYFGKEIDPLCLNYKISECKASKEQVAEYIMYILKKYSLKDIVNILKKSSFTEKSTPENIPQAHTFECINETIDMLYQLKDQQDINFLKLGCNLRKGENMKDNAYKKYGENRSKLAALLDLVVISNKGGRNSFMHLSSLGEKVYLLNNKEREDIISKLFLRIPIIQKSVINDCDFGCIEEDLKVLSTETQKRREGDITLIIRYFLSKLY